MTLSNKKQSGVAYVSRRAFLALAATGAGTALVPDNALASSLKRTCEIVDSLQRPVTIKGDGDKCVIPLGPNAQAFLELLCPSSLAALVVPLSEESPMCANVNTAELDSLPQTGNAQNEAVFSSVLSDAPKTKRIKPSLILDIGAPKNTTEEELDSLEKETGIPCAFIDISFGKLPDAFRKASVLLGCVSRGEELASAVERSLELSANSLKSSLPTSVFYAPRENGIKVRSGISVQLEAIEHVGGQLITNAYDYDRKTVKFDILVQENPDVIIFDDIDIVSSLKESDDEVHEKWRVIPAIEWQRFVVSPSLIKSWFGSAVLVQSIGVLWLAKVLNPDYSAYELTPEIRKLYSLFYGLEKTEEEINVLIG